MDLSRFPPQPPLHLEQQEPTHCVASASGEPVVSPSYAWSGASFGVVGAKGIRLHHVLRRARFTEQVLPVVGGIFGWRVAPSLGC